ncbi:MAG: hypothetical protein Q9M28_02995 [Mariprofundaceae bacterium]|nr:hypothetical protein [Mariprofundaceae bacterium]
MRRMRPITFLFPLLLVGCADLPPIFMSHEDGQKKATATETNVGQEPSRQALEVPPELRGKVSVPTPEKIASAPDAVAVKRVNQAIGEPIAADKEAVVGKHFTLDTRMYDQSTATVFSSVVDAMTSLNIPVQSVDSPSGVLTSDWIRQDAGTLQAAVSTMIGGGKNSVRYRYVIRVLKNDKAKTLLQVRTLGQVFTNRHWVNRQIQRKVSNELFSAVEERL